MKKVKFAETLKMLIKKKGVSAREVSRASGVPQATISAFMQGGSSQKPEHVLALAKYFSVSMEYILFQETDDEPKINELDLEGVFDGWLKVRIERAIPNRKK